VTKEPDHRGEREVSRKTIARGMPGDFRCDRGDYARVLYFILHARLRVHWASGIPCALCFLRANASCTTRAHRAARSRSCVCCLGIESRLCRWRVPQLLFPPPLWGRVREGGGGIGTARVDPSPTRWEGAHRRCWNIDASLQMDCAGYDDGQGGASPRNDGFWIASSLTLLAMANPKHRYPRPARSRSPIPSRRDGHDLRRRWRHWCRLIRRRI
jgi:hypothetical protein